MPSVNPTDIIRTHSLWKQYTTWIRSSVYKELQHKILQWRRKYLCVGLFILYIYHHKYIYRVFLFFLQTLNGGCEPGLETLKLEKLHRDCFNFLHRCPALPMRENSSFSGVSTCYILWLSIHNFFAIDCIPNRFFKLKQRPQVGHT